MPSDYVINITCAKSLLLWLFADLESIHELREEIVSVVNNSYCAELLVSLFASENVRKKVCAR